MRARLCEHVLREIYGHDAAARQTFELQASESPRAAACVHHRLVTIKAQAFEHLHAPGELGCGEAMVGGRIPLGRRHPAFRLSSLPVMR